MVSHRGDSRDVIRGAVMNSDLVKDAKERGFRMRYWTEPSRSVRVRRWRRALA